MRPLGIALLLVVIGLLFGNHITSTAATTACIAEDGSTKTLSSSHVNDNYCDCMKDGEDEPATSACAHVSKKFICEKDVDKKAISLAFVNDRICDCCDGSDEEAGLCPDTCDKVREGVIKKVTAEIELNVQGEEIKRQYVKQGKEGVKQLQGVVKQLKQDLQRDEEELQDKLYSQSVSQQVLQQMYLTFLQKKQQLETLETLASSPTSFGTKREYFPLFGKCFAIQSNEKHFKGGSFENEAKDFLFEVCPFERVTQVGTEAGATPTLLGVWQGWDQSHIHMIYSGGDECWNGPARTVMVAMTCALEDKLVDVRENGKCTYEFVFASPAACSKKHADQLKKYLKQIAPELAEKEIIHDEL